MKSKNIVQPNCGWGMLCDTCEHIKSPFEPMDMFNCNKVKQKGGIVHPEFIMKDGTIIDAFVTDLVRFEDGTEQCSDYEHIKVKGIK
jgi:hypothetical protein